MLRRCRSTMVCVHVSMFVFAMKWICFMIWAFTIIHQPQFPSQLVDALKWWFSIQIKSLHVGFLESWSTNLKHQLTCGFLIAQLDTLLPYSPGSNAKKTVPEVLLTKEVGSYLAPWSRWDKSWNKWSLVVVVVVVVVCSLLLFLLLDVVGGGWMLVLFFCLSILFNWNLPLQIILKIISCTDVMRHHSSVESFFVIIHVCSLILIIIFIIIIIIIIVHIIHMTFMIIVKFLFMSISMC